MSLATLTFKLYTDSGLTTLYSGTTSLLHKTDQSDNPQIITLYLGSNTASRTLRAHSNPGVDQIAITPTDITPLWQASHTYTANTNAVEPATPNTYWYLCTTSGTSGSSAPTWPTGGIGSTVTDGSVIWTLQGKTHPITEIKLAATSDFSGSSAGGALNLGTSILSGVGNAKPIWIQVTNSVVTVSNDTSWPELGLFINQVDES